MSQAVAYLRRSRVDTRRPGTLSHEQQLERIRAEAARHGDADVLVIEDWGKSGREEKTHLRQGFARLEQMVEAGEASAIYAFDLSRLGRSVITMHRLAKRCGELKIPIRCAQGLSPDVSSAEGRMVLTILLAIGEFYADNVQERARAVTMMRRERGDRIGKAPYGQRVRGGKLEPNPDEDLAAVLAAYDRAGSVMAACRALNAAGVQTRNGGAWRSSTLSQVLEAAGRIHRRPSAGRPATRAHLFSGLLRCHCGALMSPQVTNGGRNVGYQCKRARHDAAHSRPASISEIRLLPMVRELFDALDWGAERAEIPGAEIDRDELEARRRRVLDNYEDGLISRDERNAKLAALDEQIRAGGYATTVEAIPTAIDWTWPTEDVNRLLRLLIERVELGTDLLPVRIGWRGRIADWA
jgi:DNA invertase Pin-like site-specific DNA recombinase